MPNEMVAKSVLELLIHPNPTVSHRVPSSKTNTRGGRWHCPERLNVWEDMGDFKTLADSFGGRLLEEALRERTRLPCYPLVHSGTDCVIRDEKDTEGLINKWNKEVVNAALFATQSEFRTAIWCKGDPPPLKPKDASETPPTPNPDRIQPPRRKKNLRKPSSQSLRALKSDSGSILYHSSPSATDSEATSFRREVFPKEYKPAEKWMSKWMDDCHLINQDGRWQRGQRSHNYAWPIRQAYTYCIQHMCRYGCILTCREAFIFRVKPIDEAPGDGSEDIEELRSKLIHNGLMEYISIPWDNHHQGEIKKCKDWTVNLALWFVHILAAANHKVAWEYNSLVKETLTVPIFVNGQENSSNTSITGVEVTSGQVNDAAKEEAADEENDGEIYEGTVEHVDEETEEDEAERSVDSDRSSNSDGSVDIIHLRATPGAKRKRGLDSEDGIHLSFSKRPVLEN